MFGIGNVFNPATIFGSMLGGPLGAIIAQALQQVVSQVVQEIIQKAGEQLGLPQQFIDMAQGAAAGAMGDAQGATRNLQEAIQGFVAATGATGAAAGNLQREATDSVQSFIDQQAAEMARAVGQEASESNGSGGGSAVNAKGSVLMRIAMALGRAMDNKVDQMGAKATELESMGEITGKNTSKYNALSAEMSALGQELKIVGEALNNTLKAIGDASSALARRQ
jgi:hypothetical protein